MAFQEDSISSAQDQTREDANSTREVVGRSAEDDTRSTAGQDPGGSPPEASTPKSGEGDGDQPDDGPPPFNTEDAARFIEETLSSSTLIKWVRGLTGLDGIDARCHVAASLRHLRLRDESRGWDGVPEEVTKPIFARLFPVDKDVEDAWGRMPVDSLKAVDQWPKFAPPALDPWMTEKTQLALGIRNAYRVHSAEMAAEQEDAEFCRSKVALPRFTGTYSDVCELFRIGGHRELLIGVPGPLEYNELTMSPEAGRGGLDPDLIVPRARENVETLFVIPALKDKRGKMLEPPRKPVITVDKIEMALEHVARERAYHPVRNYLNGLSWDGQPRLADLICTVFGAPPSTEATRFVRWWFVQAVARAFRPGCKADLILILYSARQGIKKSTFFKELVPDPAWFSDDKIHMSGDKDSLMVLHTRFIIELSELAVLAKSELEEIKGFIARSTDTFRRPYARGVKSYPRAFVFGGTADKKFFLRDPSGNRRFLPLELPGTVGDIEWLKGNRDQIWAEAVHLYNDGFQPYPSAEELKEIDAYLQGFQAAADVQEDDIVRFLPEMVGIFNSKILVEKAWPQLFTRTIWDEEAGEWRSVEVEPPAEELKRVLIRVEAVLMKYGFENSGANAKSIGGERRRGWFATERSKARLEAAGILVPRKETKDEF